MFQIGCHLSSSKGYLAMGKEAVKLNANTFQFFTRNPRGGKAKAIDEQDVAAFLTFAEGHGIYSILAHAPYTLNACSKDERTREFALETMTDDLRRMEYTPNQLYNFHPGSHVGVRNRHHSKCSAAEDSFDRGTNHHRFAGNHGGKGNGNRAQL